MNKEQTRAAMHELEDISDAVDQIVAQMRNRGTINWPTILRVASTAIRCVADEMGDFCKATVRPCPDCDSPDWEPGQPCGSCELDPVCDMEGCRKPQSEHGYCVDHCPF